MKIVIVEDQALFMEFVSMTVTEQLGHELVGVASDGEAALDVIRKTQPALVILDILIPKLSGIEVARILLKEFPTIRILALSSEMDPRTVHEVRKLNIPGFIDKNEASIDVLIRGIQEVSKRRRFYSASVMRAIRDLQIDPNGFQKILSPREQEVLSLIGGGKDNQEISSLLGISVSSVQTHRKHLHQKLGVNSTPKLIAFAHETGFWKPAFTRMGIQPPCRAKT